jgi:hypothetical protein
MATKPSVKPSTKARSRFPWIALVPIAVGFSALSLAGRLASWGASFAIAVATGIVGALIACLAPPWYIARALSRRLDVNDPRRAQRQRTTLVVWSALTCFAMVFGFGDLWAGVKSLVASYGSAPHASSSASGAPSSSAPAPSASASAAAPSDASVDAGPEDASFEAGVATWDGGAWGANDIARRAAGRCRVTHGVATTVPAFDKLRVGPSGDAVVIGNLAYHGGSFVARIGKDGALVFRKPFAESSGEVAVDAHLDAAGRVVAIVQLAVPGAAAPKLGEPATSDLAVVILDGATGAERSRRALLKSGAIEFVDGRVVGAALVVVVRFHGAIDLGGGAALDSHDDAAYALTLPLDGSPGRARAVYARGATIVQSDGSIASLEQRGGRTVDDLGAGRATLVALTDEQGKKTHAGALDVMVTREGGGARVNAFAPGDGGALWLGGYVTVPGVVHDVDDHFLLAKLSSSGKTDLLLQGGAPDGNQGVFALARTASGFLVVGGSLKRELALPTGTLASPTPRAFVAVLDPDDAPCFGETIDTARVRHAIAASGDEVVLGGEGGIAGAIDAGAVANGPLGFVLRATVER